VSGRRYFRVSTTTHDRTMEREPVFREVQRFRQPWVWALLGGIALLMFVLGPVLLGWAPRRRCGRWIRLQSSSPDRSEGRRHLSQTVATTSVVPSNFVVGDRTIRVDTIPATRDFGGWGIRWAPGKIAYNVSGNRGVWFERTDGRGVLVGSQRPEELVSAIDESVPQPRDGGQSAHCLAVFRTLSSGRTSQRRR